MRSTLILCTLFAFFQLGCEKSDSFHSKVQNADDLAHIQNKQKAVLRTLQGRIVIKFFPDKAPISVQRIAQLITEGFYNNLTFHRVVPGFVVQTGDPTGTGTGGSGKSLKAEFNDVPHVRGTVALARTNDPDSADSQFYITLNTFDELNGKYTVIGQVVEGIEFLDKIAKGDKIISLTMTN